MFLSYTWADRDPVERLAQALRDLRLEVFTDKPEIEDFAPITSTITQALANAKALLAYYSATYPTRRACQWELTAAYLAAQREGDPSRRILVVNPEPTADHLHPGELRDALFRRAPVQGDQEALAELARAVAGHVHKLEGTLGEVAPLVPVRWLPTQGLGSTRFVGRLPDMWKMHSALHPETTRLTVGRTGPAVAQLRGLGGIGKSLLAEEYALRFGAAYPGGVFWLRAYGSHDQADLPPEELDVRRHDEVRHIAELLGIATRQFSPEEVTGAIATAIQERGEPCLWVVDDLPTGLDARQVRAWLAPHPLAHTLVTTRSQAYGALAPAIDLDVLDEPDAYQLLTSHRPPTSADEAQAARGIVAALGFHALAVDVAGAALAAQQGLVSYTQFLTGLAAPDEDELELLTDLANALPNGHEASITRTLLRSTRQLGAEGWDFLHLAASLARAPIPAELVKAVFAQADGLAEQPATRRAARAVHQAATLSLASTTAAADEPTGLWLVHALVARTVRFRDPDPARRAALREAAIAVFTQRLQAIVDARAHVMLQAVVPHARELARQPVTTAEAGLLGWVARYDFARGAFRPAELGYRRQWDALRRLLGDDHPDTLTSMNNLAITLYHLGDLDGARDLHQQALDARRRLLGPNHPDTLQSINNLATTLYHLGDLDGARDLDQQALDARRRLLGPDHPDTLESMNNLAATLDALGDLDGARDLHQQVLDARRRLLGPNHPDTLLSMNNLAATLADLGNLAGARDLVQQALDASRRVLGDDHPNTQVIERNLMAVVSAQREAGASDGPAP